MNSRTPANGGGGGGRNGSEEAGHKQRDNRQWRRRHCLVPCKGQSYRKACSEACVFMSTKLSRKWKGLLLGWRPTAPGAWSGGLPARAAAGTQTQQPAGPRGMPLGTQQHQRVRLPVSSLRSTGAQCVAVWPFPSAAALFKVLTHQRSQHGPAAGLQKRHLSRVSGIIEYMQRS